MSVKSVIIHRKWDSCFDVTRQYFNVSQDVNGVQDEIMALALTFWDPWQRICYQITSDGDLK